MKRNKRFKPFSNFMIKRRKKKLQEEYVELSEEGLDFVADSSGFTCTRYYFSDEYYDYIQSFQNNVKAELDSMDLDEFNGDFKNLELNKVSEYERTFLEKQKIEHKFTNTKIESGLISAQQSYENEIKLLDQMTLLLEEEAKK